MECGGADLGKGTAGTIILRQEISESVKGQELVLVYLECLCYLPVIT